MPENFKALRFPQDLGTESSPNYITFMPEEVRYKPQEYGNKVDRGSGGLFSSSERGGLDIDLGAGNPFKQLGESIGGQLTSIADAAIDSINAIGSLFDGGSLSATATKFGKLVNGKVKIGDFILSSGLKTEAPQVKQLGSISLYLPDTLNATTAAEYSAKEIGSLGQAAIMQQDKSVVDTIKDGQKSDSSIASGLLGEIVRQSGQTGDILAVQSGQIVNPFSYQVFGGMAHRTFNYQFDLVPRNSREAEEVKRICDMFLFYMLPSAGNEAKGVQDFGLGGKEGVDKIKSNFFLKMPSQWDIKYYRNGNQLTHHQQPFKCFLSSCDIQYGGDAENFLHEDGSPVKTSLSLSYVEIEPLMRR